MRDEELIADQPRQNGCLTEGCGCLVVMFVVVPGILMLLGSCMAVFQ